MKKYLSIFELFVRSSIYKIIFVLLVMGIAEMAMFYEEVSQVTEYEYYSLESVVDGSNLIGCFGLAFLAITLILSSYGCNVGSRQDYTLQRLQVREKTVFWIQGIYNSLCYLLFLGTQVILLFLMGSFYLQTASDVTNQTLFLAFYRNKFMHSILPMEAVFRWFMNGILVIGCGITTAGFPYLQRRGKIGLTVIVTAGWLMAGFVYRIGDLNLLITVFWILAAAGMTLYRIYQKEEA